MAKIIECPNKEYPSFFSYEYHLTTADLCSLVQDMLYGLKLPCDTGEVTMMVGRIHNSIKCMQFEQNPNNFGSNEETLSEQIEKIAEAQNG